MLKLETLTSEIIRTQNTLYTGSFGDISDGALGAAALKTATQLVTLSHLGPIIESLGPAYLDLMKMLMRGAEEFMNEETEPNELEFIGFPTNGDYDS